MDASASLDSNDTFASLRSHFGQEALDAYTQRLTAFAFTYVDDIFEFAGNYPEWCAFKAPVPG